MNLLGKTVLGFAVPIVGLVAWSFGITGVFGISPGMMLSPSTFAFDPGPDPISVRHPSSEQPRVVPASERITPPPALPCSLPRPAGDDQVVVFGARAGAALSTVALAGQDKVTTAARVVIEPGKDPIYLLLSSDEPTIWTFDGATQRLHRVVLATEFAAPQKRSAGGAVGVSPDIVSFMRPGDCFHYFYGIDGAAGDLMVDTLKRILGRVPDTLANGYSVIGVSLPSGNAAAPRSGSTSPPKGYDSLEWSVLMRRSLGGMIVVSPSDIVAQVSPVAYDVPPQEAGLALLIGNGSLVQTDRGLRIQKPIARYPAELTGDHAVHFVLAAGINPPKGDAGESCVIADNGRNVANPSHC